MGNWNRRYMPRKKFRHYDYEDPPSSPPRSYNNQSYSSDNRMSSWEIDYCNSVRVSWKKVLASKKYIYSYPSVLNWDASASNEALQNAKERFWAMINGICCDNPLPDPNQYIDEIDWNPHMDPELMSELDLPIFDPDKAQKGEKLEATSGWVECAQIQDDKNQYTGDNPWERNTTQGTGSLKDTSDNPCYRTNTQGAGSFKDISDNPWEINNTQGAGSSKDLQGWDRWDDLVYPNDGNPWEQNYSNPVDSLKDNAWRSGNENAWGSGNNNAWGSGNESWGWNKGIDNRRSSPFVDYKRGNSCNVNGQSLAARQRWGQGRGRGWGPRENNSWVSSAVNRNAEEQMNLVNCGYLFDNNYSSGSKERGWREKKNEPWGGKEPKYWDSQTSWRGGRSFRGGGRKRESSLQHTSKYKSIKCHGNTYGNGH